MPSCHNSTRSGRLEAGDSRRKMAGRRSGQSQGNRKIRRNANGLAKHRARAAGKPPHGLGPAIGTRRCQNGDGPIGSVISGNRIFRGSADTSAPVSDRIAAESPRRPGHAPRASGHPRIRPKFRQQIAATSRLNAEALKGLYAAHCNRKGDGSVKSQRINRLKSLARH